MLPGLICTVFARLLYNYDSENNYPALGYNVPKSTGKQVFYCYDFGSKQTKILMKIPTRLWIVNIDELLSSVCE
jgi:hypothetical protein